jgi:hypothetical protein
MGIVMSRRIGIACAVLVVACGCTEDKKPKERKTESVASSASMPPPSITASAHAPTTPSPSASAHQPLAPRSAARVTVVGKDHPGLLAHLRGAKGVKSCALDEIDGKPARSAVLSREHPSVFTGWAADMGSGKLGAVRLVFQGADGTLYQGPARRGPKRPDVAAVFKKPALTASGFVARLDVRDVPAGLYRIEVLQILGPEKTTLCDTSLAVTVR